MNSAAELVWQEGIKPSDPAEFAKCPRCGGKVLKLFRPRDGGFDFMVMCDSCGEKYE